MERLLAGLLLITAPTGMLADPPPDAVPKTLPAALKPDFSKAKEIVVPAELLKAMLNPDPGPDTPASKPFPIRNTAAEVGEIRFGTVSSKVLVGVCDPKVAPAPVTGVRPVLSVDRFELAKGRFLGSHPVPDKYRLLSVSPEVNLVLCCSMKPNEPVADGETEGRLEVWNLETGKHIAGWYPYGKAGALDDVIANAGFIPGERVLSINAAGKAIVWDFTTAKALATSQLGESLSVRMTPGGKYLLNLTHKGIRVFDSFTLQLAGDFAFPDGLPQGTKEPVGIAIRTTGEEVAALVKIFPEGVNYPLMVIIRWDFRTGRVLGTTSFWANGEGNNQQLSLDYAGPEHIMLNTGHLIDIKRNLLVWRYRLPGTMAKATMNSPDGRYWFTTATNAEVLASLLAVHIPETSVEKTLRTVLDAGKQVLGPGSSVAIELNGPFEGPEKDEALASVKTMLIGAGYKPAEKAEAVLAVTVAFEPGEFKTTLRLTYGGKTAWEAMNLVTKAPMKDKPPAFDPSDPFRMKFRPKVELWMVDMLIPSKIVLAGGKLYTLPGDSELHIPIPHTPKK